MVRLSYRLYSILPFGEKVIYPVKPSRNLFLGAPLHSRNPAFNRMGNLVGGFMKREFKRFADRNPNGTRARPDAVGLPHFEEAINAHWQYRHAQVCRQKACAGPKWQQASITRDAALRKHHDAKATIYRLARVMKTFPEARELGQRKYVEKQRDQEIVHAIEKRPKKTAIFGRMAIRAQAFASHGPRQPIAVAKRESGGDKANVFGSDVVAGNQ